VHRGIRKTLQKTDSYAKTGTVGILVHQCQQNHRRALQFYNNENAVVASVTVVPLQFDQQQKCIAVAALPGNQCTWVAQTKKKRHLFQ
jgi:hypothetical protein